MYKRKSIFFVLVFLFFLVSCSKLKEQGYQAFPNIAANNTEELASHQMNACIQSPAIFAYEINGHEDENKTPTIVLPSTPWEFVSDLPANSNSGEIVFSYQNREIWIRNRNHSFLEIYDPFYKQAFTEYLVFVMETETWKIVPSITREKESIAYDLFLQKDGNILASNIPYGNNSEIPIPVLSIYDREKNEFRAVVESKGFFNITPDKVYGSSYIARANTINKSGSEILWFFVQKDGIYAYEIETAKFSKKVSFSDNEFLQKVYKGSERIKNAYVSPDSKIFLTFFDSNQTYYQPTLEDFPMFYFDVEQKEIVPIVLQLAPWPIYKNYLIDSNGRFWFDSLGWWDTKNGSWYQIQQPSLFITSRRSDAMTNRLSTPEILLESEDGKMWFYHDNGMISLDPDKGEWCWFTTYQSNIIEDADHNLWMIADGKLYKYPSRP